MGKRTRSDIHIDAYQVDQDTVLNVAAPGVLENDSDPEGDELTVLRAVGPWDGSLIMSASMLAMLDYCDAVESGEILSPQKSKRRVLGVDIDIRAHNRAAIEAHPMYHLIDMIEGSSIAPEVISQVCGIAEKYRRVLVLLDSNHTHDHVLAELEAYAPLTSKGSYCVVFDTVVEDLPDELSPERPWGKGNNPKTAVSEYLNLMMEPAFKNKASRQPKISLITLARRIDLFGT